MKLNSMQGKTKFTVITCVLVFLSFLFQFAVFKNILYKVYKWQLVQPETLKGLFELSVIFVLLFLAIYFLKNFWARLFIVGVSVLFLWFHAIILPAAVSILYLEIIMSIGKFVFNCFHKKDKNSENYLVFFVWGITVWAVVSIICSLAGFGTFNDLRIVTGLLLLISITKGLNPPFVVYLFKKTSVFDRRELAMLSFLVLLVLIQFAKSNSTLAYEFDSLWYGLRPENVLVGEHSFYDNLGLVSFVHVYPKLFELFLIPVSNLGNYSYILSVNVILYALIIYVIYTLLQNLGNRRLYSLFFTCLIASIPALSNMASTAKSDLFSIFLMLFGVLCIWNWINDLKVTHANKNINLLWLAATSFILSFGGKPSSIVYVPFIVLGTVLYLLLNKQLFKNKEIKQILGINRGEILIFIGALGVFLGICYRTFKLTGVPMYPILGRVWSILGFENRYPFIIKNVGETTSSFNLHEIISRWYHLLFDPQPFGHVIMLWTGNIGLFLVIVIIAMGLLKKVNFPKQGIIYLLVPLYLVGAYYATFLPNAGDGNIYIVPLTLLLVVLLSSLFQRNSSFNKSLLLALVIFIPFHMITMFVSHPSWSYGMSPLNAKSYNNSEQLKKNLFKYNGIYNIADYLEKADARERCIGIGDDVLLNQLSCRMETINATQSDYLGNSKLYSNLENLIEFVKWSKVKYIILPKDAPQQYQDIYYMLDQIRNVVQNNNGTVISDEKFDLVLVDQQNLLAVKDININYLDGWYNYEGDYRWINKSATLKVSTAKNGRLVINGVVPDVYQEIIFNLYVDGRLIDSKKLKPGQFSIENILEGQKAKADLKIEMSSSFIPKELGINDDTRELSIMINSIDLISS